MRFLLIGLLAAIVVGVAGWGVVIARATDDEGDVQRDHQPPSAAEIEDFARFEFPASARALRATDKGGIDYWLEAKFIVDRADVAALLESARLEPQRLGDELHAQDEQPGYHRRLTVRLDHPRTASVHLTAFTT